MKKTQEEKSAIRRKREQKELAKWEKELNRPKGKFYYWYLALIITLVYMVDEITSQIGTQMQTEIAIGLFADRMSIMNALSAATFPLIILSVLYKTLSDRYGRRLFLCINTLGMGIGLFLVFLAGKIGDMGGIITYIAATAVINFFIPNDTQLVYIMETADENKRGTMYSIIKSIATVSVMLIPLMRKAFMGDDVTKWENVYIVPMFLALVAAIMCFITAREPDVFLHNRIAYLKMSDEEKDALKNAKDASQEKGGLGKAFKFAFSHKQLRWLFIVAAIWGLGALAIQYYGRIMANYYSTEEVTSALMMYPITCALMMLLNGSVGDRIGRKPVVVAMAAISFVSFGVLFLACNNHWSPIVAGLLLGSYIGAFYSAGDNISSLMTGESAPTNMRASVMSAQSVVNIISKMFAMIVPLVALFITKDNYAVLGVLCVFGSLPAMFVSLFFLITKVGDTSHVNLDTVKGDEWDNK